MKTLEIRSLAGAVECRAAGEDSTLRTLVSIVPPWGRWSEVITDPKTGLRFRERFERGAFDLEGADVEANFDHNSTDYLLGTTGAGTLRLADTEEGMRYEVDMPLSQGYVLELVERGDVRGSSFAFVKTDDRWEREEGSGIELRTVMKAVLRQVGPVRRPAYSGTELAVRSLSEWEHEQGMSLEMAGRRVALEEIL